MRPVLLLLMTTLPLPALADTTLRVMSYNIWGGGANEGKGIEETLAVIRAANPDVIGLQEVRTEGETCEADYCPPGPDSVGPALAEALGWHYHEQTEENVALWANGVLSRYPITGTAANDLGVSIDVDGTTVWVFNIHHDDSPYQPYQLLDIEYGDAPFIDTAQDAVRFASDTRGPAMELLFAAMDSAAPTGPVFVTGDFNEPSGLDWTEAAVAAGLHPIAVDWPTTGALMAAGSPMPTARSTLIRWRNPPSPGRRCTPRTQPTTTPTASTLSLSGAQPWRMPGSWAKPDRGPIWPWTRGRRTTAPCWPR